MSRLQRDENRGLRRTVSMATSQRNRATEVRVAKTGFRCIAGLGHRGRQSMTCTIPIQASTTSRERRLRHCSCISTSTAFCTTKPSTSARNRASIFASLDLNCSSGRISLSARLSLTPRFESCCRRVGAGSLVFRERANGCPPSYSIVLLVERFIGAHMERHSRCGTHSRRWHVECRFSTTFVGGGPSTGWHLTMQLKVGRRTIEATWSPVKASADCPMRTPEMRLPPDCN